MKALPEENRIAFQLCWEVAVLGFILLRFWVTRKKQRSVAAIAADVQIVLSWLLTMVADSVLIWEGMDIIEYRDSKIKDPRQHPLLKEKLHKINFSLVFLYLTIIWLVKGAFIAFYFDLFPRYGLSKKLRWALYGTTGLTVATFLTNVLMHGLFCQPIETAWLIGPGNCNSQRHIPTLTAATFTNVVNDLIIMALPITVLRSLNLRRRDLVALSFVFIVGVITILAAIIRYAVVYETYTKPSAANDFEKKINDIMVVMSWCFIEAYMAQIAFCLPAFRVYLRGKKGDSSTRPTGLNTVGSAGKQLKLSKASQTSSVDSISQTELVSYGANSHNSLDRAEMAMSGYDYNSHLRGPVGLSFAK